MKTLFFINRVLICASTMCLTANLAGAQNWQPTTSPAQWSKIACSADGTRLVAIAPRPVWQVNEFWASTDSGTTWTLLGNDAPTDVACNSDGTRFIRNDPYVADVLMRYSPTTGWSEDYLPTKGSLVASSANGMSLLSAGAYYTGYPIITNNDRIQASVDGGVSFKTVLTNVAIKALACSGSGATFVAASTSNVIYISTNSGANWSTNVVDKLWDGSWNSLASSADGSRIFAASEDGIFVSTNVGLNWTQIHPPDSFQSMAVSADGTQILVAARAGLLYTSTNSGVDWNLSTLTGLSGYTNSNDIITAVAMSTDGASMFAAPLYGSIYTSFPTLGGFVNLDFESATQFIPLMPLGGSGWFPFAQAFPGWAENIGGNTDWDALVNSMALDSSIISLIDTNSFLGSLVIGGKYTAVLQAGLWYTPSNQFVVTDTTLSQTALIPQGTKSLRFKAMLAPAFAVTLGGEALTVTTLGSGSNYFLYGANVSQWAGKTNQLSFTVYGENPHRSNRSLVLDDIQFSTQPVPLPPLISLSTSISADNIQLSWTPPGGNLESSPVLGPGATWSVVGAQNPTNVPISGGAKFFRIRP